MEEAIRECQTLKQLELLGGNYIFTDREREQVFEKKVVIVQRVVQWRRKNKLLGLTPILTDTWTPDERQRFLAEWGNDDGLQDVLSQQNDEIFQEELPREISLVKKMKRRQ